MRRRDVFAVLLLLVGIVVVALRDVSLPEARRPLPPLPPFPGGAPEGAALPSPSAADPLVEIEAPVKDSDVTGTAFSVDDDGVWLTARHVTESCGDVLIQTGPREAIRALRVVAHPAADVAVIETRRGAPALALGAGLERGETGFHFGFPSGDPGEVMSSLLGRARLRLNGPRGRIEPVVAWAEIARVPAGLDHLSGISGGPVLSADGEVVGVNVASSVRRGRVFTAAPVSLRETLERAGAAPASSLPGGPPRLSGNAFSEVGESLRRTLTVAKVICLLPRPSRRPLS